MEEFIFIMSNKYFSRRRIIDGEKMKEYKRYYRGDTINGVKKYVWNFFMKLNSKELSTVKNKNND